MTDTMTTPAATVAAPASVLVIDSEAGHTTAITPVLEQSGFSVRSESDTEGGLRAFGEQRPDIVLLDIDLHDRRGLDACRRIRQASGVPMLIVSRRTSEFDVVVALEVGADGYVLKPCRPRELVARMRALLRRRTHEGPEPNTDLLAAGDIVLDLARHVVEIRGAPVDLPLKEFALLELLLRHPGRALTRDFLIEKVWGRGRGATKTLDLHIKRLRERIEVEPAEPRALVTVRGYGFRLEAAQSGSALTSRSESA